MDKELFATVFNVGLMVLGFFGAFAINRLAKSIDELVRADKDMSTIIHEHREDVIKNYATNKTVDVLRSDLQEQMRGVKQDIIGRVDRLELAFKDALMAHEHREQAMYTRSQTIKDQP